MEEWEVERCSEETFTDLDRYGRDQCVASNLWRSSIFEDSF